MVKKYQNGNKTIELDDTFSIWGAIFGCFYPFYKGFGKAGGILLAINVGIAIVLMPLDSTIGLLINCAVAGFVSPKLMFNQLQSEQWTEIN